MHCIRHRTWFLTPGAPHKGISEVLWPGKRELESYDFPEVYRTGQSVILGAHILRSATVMEDLTAAVLGEWESEGGATIRLDVCAHVATQGFMPNVAAKTILVGTPNQIEWAEQIKDCVHKEFDRVGMILKSVAAKQVGSYQADTL